MIDCREIQIVDNTFDLKNTVAQNQELKNDNKFLYWLAISAGLLIIGVSIYLAKEKNSENHKKQKGF